MPRIKISNFGPIKNGAVKSKGWIDIKKVTVFIGNQGSGKSTVAKLISMFSWIEKALVRGDFNKKWFERKGSFKNELLKFHRLENYYRNDLSNMTELVYEGDAYSIKILNENLVIEERKKKEYALPQVMYIPAERNFVSYLDKAQELRLSSESLQEFLIEFNNAKKSLKSINLKDLNDLNLNYDEKKDILNIQGKGYEIPLKEAASGIQSFIPVYLVSKYLSKKVSKDFEAPQSEMTTKELQKFKADFDKIWSNELLSQEQKKAAIGTLTSRFNKKSFINIVEELEQNLFPSSQKNLLYSLLEFNNEIPSNRLILTTHSPFLLLYLSLAIQAGKIFNNYQDKLNTKLKKSLDQIVPKPSMIHASDLVIYEMNEKNGKIEKLESFEGIPSDNNYLNNFLAEGNSLFDKLMEIEEECLQ